MHNAGYKSALARRACRYSDAQPPRKTDGVLLESEIPPHMRGKELLDLESLPELGITPAYAGKRAQYRLQRRCGWDHPRVCGEKPDAPRLTETRKGSPPHMRGKVLREGLREHRLRITPAYAGKSEEIDRDAEIQRDHPRICGEKVRAVLRYAPFVGSPPHMRGKGHLSAAFCGLPGITPAYAGKRIL